MTDGPFWRIALITAILLLPVAHARAPETNLDIARSLGGQDLTGLAMDPTGQFVAAVVNVDSQKTVNNLLGSQERFDIYTCDFGPASRPNAGSGCHGLNHATGASAVPPAQKVAATSTDQGNGLRGIYAVGGPGGTVSLWTTTRDTYLWEINAPDNLIVLDVDVAPDGRRVAALLAPSAVATSGRVAVFDANAEGKLLWDYNLTDSQDTSVRPTSIAISRENGVMAVGTTNGVVLFDLDGSRPTSPGRLTQTGEVRDVQLSRDGSVLAAAAKNGIFLAPLTKDGSRITTEPTNVYNRGLGPDGAQHVELSLDGSRFAASSGSEIHFFERLSALDFAKESYEVGATVRDLAADARARLVVAITSTQAFGFAPATGNTPIWSFDATQPASGGLDSPLAAVDVNDGGQRLVIGGKTKIMPYSNVVSARAQLDVAEGNASIVPAVERRFTLTVTNTGSLPDNYTFVVERPAGWTGQNPPTLALAPEQTRAVNLTLQAPEGQPPGGFALTVKARSARLLEEGRADPVAASASYNLTVPRAVSLIVEVEPERLQFRQGQEQVIPVKVRNVGNAGGLVNLSAKQDLTRGNSWDVRFQPEQVEIPSGSSADVRMLVTAPSDAASGDRNILTAFAKEGTQVSGNDTLIAYVDAQFGADLRTDNRTLFFKPSDIRTIIVTIVNRGNTEDTFNLTHVLSPQPAANDWRVTLDREHITIPRGESRTMTVTIKPTVAEPQDGTLTLKTESQADPAKKEDSLVLSLYSQAPELEEDDRFVPAPGLATLLGVVAVAAAFARRATLGGRRG